MIPPFLMILIAMGGASCAWRAYSSLYQRQHATSLPLDPVSHNWWRALSKAVAIGLLGFVSLVTVAALRAPGWLALFFFGVLAVSLMVASVCVGTLWRRAAP